MAALQSNLRWVKAPGLTVDFQRSHIDRMPLGNLAGTIFTLVVGLPEIHWIFNYTVIDQTYEFDDEAIKEVLAGISPHRTGSSGIPPGNLEDGDR